MEKRTELNRLYARFNRRNETLRRKFANSIGKKRDSKCPEYVRRLAELIDEFYRDIDNITRGI